MEPVCYEMSSHVGGLWHYTESVNERQACVIKTTVANLSKEMMCFSDFPPDKRTPIYMHNTDALDYFEKYASHNKLLSRIQLNTEVGKGYINISCTCLACWINISADDLFITLKTPRKPENVVCLCRQLKILANFSNLFLHTGIQCGPRSNCS